MIINTFNITTASEKKNVFVQGGPLVVINGVTNHKNGLINR